MKLKGAARIIKRASGLIATETPPLTPEEVRAMFQVLDEWLSRPEVMAPSRHTVLEGVRLGKDGRDRAKRYRVLRLKAWVALVTHYGMRTGDIASMNWADLDSESVRWTISKGRDYPEPVSRDMHPQVWSAVSAWREAAGDRTLWGNVRTMTDDTRRLMLAAGIPEHNGRLGLHRVRGGIATAAASAGLSMFDAAAALGHRDTHRPRSASMRRTRGASMLLNAASLSGKNRFEISR